MSVYHHHHRIRAFVSFSFFRCIGVRCSQVLTTFFHSKTQKWQNYCITVTLWVILSWLPFPIRTNLAWSRSCISCFVVGIMLKVIWSNEIEGHFSNYLLFTIKREAHILLLLHNNDKLIKSIKPSVRNTGIYYYGRIVHWALCTANKEVNDTFFEYEIGDGGTANSNVITVSQSQRQ